MAERVRGPESLQAVPDFRDRKYDFEYDNDDFRTVCFSGWTGGFAAKRDFSYHCT